MPDNSKRNSAETHAAARLGLWDTVSVIVGIVVGVGIFETPRLVFQMAPTPAAALGLWLIGGVLSLVGALTYAELATTYPRSGGDYVYLTMAYGRPVGFLFAWAQLSVIMTGSIGMMAYVFANYAANLAGASDQWLTALAVAPVVALTGVNMLGATFGKRAQNALTVAKILGIAGVIIGGLVWAPLASGVPTSQAGGALAAAGSAGPLDLRVALLAMVPVLLTYGGWNDAAYFAAEIRERRQIWVALVVSTVLITVLYLLLNAAYLTALGFEGARQASAVAAATLERAMGGTASRAISLLVCVSALGAMQGLIFAGSRIYATLGRDYRSFAWLGRWNDRARAPLTALAVQGAVTVAMIIVLGTATGQQWLDGAFRALGLVSVSWRHKDGFETMLRCTAPVFWLFFLLTSLSVFILRRKDPHAARPFSVPLYPVTPLVFTATCAGMLYSAVLYAGPLGIVGGALLMLGLPLYFVSRPVAYDMATAETPSP